MLQAVLSKELAFFMSHRRTPTTTTHLLPLSLLVLFNFGFELPGYWCGLGAGALFPQTKARMAMLQAVPWEGEAK